MRKAISVLWLALLAIGWLAARARADYMPDEVIARFKPNIGFRTKSFVGSSLGLRTLRSVFSSDFAVYAVPPGSTPDVTVARLQNSPYVLYAERNAIGVVTAAPNDPLYKNQWSLHPVEAGSFGINVPDAWSVSIGAGAVVAVLDTGCAFENYLQYYANPDLDPQRVRAGWDFVNGDSHPNDDSDIGHGTFMCSLIAETANNGFSASGIAPGCTLMPIKCFDSDGLSTADRLASGLSYARRFDARVVLLGGATAERSQCLQDMINDVAAQGVLVIAGAGNNGIDPARKPGVHAVYDNVLYVAATLRDGTAAPYSNHGSYISVAAPGGSEVGDAPIAASYSAFDAGMPRFGMRADGNSVQPMHGTSVAAAHVAGVAALVVAAAPGLSPAGVRAQIEKTARPLGESALFGAGLVDATAAVGAATSGTVGGDPGAGDIPAGSVDVAATSLDVPADPVVQGNTVPINVGVRNNGTDTRTVTVTLQDDTSGVTVGTRDVGLTPGQATTVTFNWQAQAPVATHSLRATATVIGDGNPLNNSRTGTVVVNPAQLQLRISPSKPSYRAGEWIFVTFNATDGGLAAPGSKITYSILGANGFPVVRSSSLTADATGEVTLTLTTYYSFGGRGTYLVEATATHNGATTTARQTFVVNSVRG
jgi:serine protease